MYNLIFDRVHRTGLHDNTKIRPIVAKFHYYAERERIRQRSYDFRETLKQCNQGIGVQMPYSVREARKSLYPIMRQERDKGNENVKMVRDKLYINGKPYTPTGQQQQPMDTHTSS